jgi:uncharacterized protein YrrD
MQHQTKILSTTTVIGDKVINPEGEELGHIEEIMFDIHSGRIAYAVMSSGGFLGLGDKLFAIPWQSLAVDTDKHAVILNADKARLENAPGFDKNNWPKTENGDRGWLDEVYDYYGTRPYWR